jgi:hypothetical protein
MTQFDTGPASLGLAPPLSQKEGATSVKRPPLGASVKAQVSFAEALTQLLASASLPSPLTLLAMCS